MKERPIVVSFIAVVMLMNGILTLLNGYRFQAPPFVLVLGAVALLLSAGLWKLWSWAWIGTVLLQIGAIGFALHDWFTGGPIDFLAIILGVIILLYFFRPQTRQAFFHSPSVQTSDLAH